MLLISLQYNLVWLIPVTLVVDSGTIYLTTRTRYKICLERRKNIEKDLFSNPHKNVSDTDISSSNMPHRPLFLGMNSTRHMSKLAISVIFLCFSLFFLPSPDGQEYVCTFYHQNYWYCWLMPLVCGTQQICMNKLRSFTSMLCLCVPFRPISHIPQCTCPISHNAQCIQFCSKVLHSIVGYGAGELQDL